MGSGAGLLVGLSLNGASIEFDTQRYHVVNAAQWLSGSFWTLPFAQPGDHTAAAPGVSDLVSAVFMLATHSVVLATLPNVLFVALAVAAAAALAERLGASPWRGVWAMVLLIGVAGYLDTQIHSMMSDVAVAAPLLAALALLLGGGRPQHQTLLLAGGCAGIACAAKYTGLLNVLAAVAVVMVLQRGAWSRLAMASIPAAAIAAPWYIRTAITAGNPLYPEAITLGPVRLPGSAGPFSVTKPVSLLHDVLAGHGGALLTTLDAYSVVLGPLLILVVLALVPNSTSPTRARRIAAALVLGWGLVYAVLPYTTGDFFHVAGAFRYALPPVTLAIILGAVRLPTRLFGAVAALGAGWDVWEYHLLPARPDLAVTLPIAAAALAAAVIVAAGPPLARRLAGWQRPAAGSAALLVGACGAAVLIAAQTPPLPASGSVADQLAGASSVACIAVSDMQAVLGPRLQTRIVAVGRDGPQGAQQEITSPREFSSALARLRPALVVVGDDASTVPVPPWSPPSDWAVIGQVGGATVYRPVWNPI